MQVFIKFLIILTASVYLVSRFYLKFADVFDITIPEKFIMKQASIEFASVVLSLFFAVLYLIIY